MTYDIPSIAAAMDQKIMQLDYVTNNLANTGTPGFKAEHLHVLKTLAEGETANDNASSSNRIVVDFAQGMSQKTGNPLDLMIQGNGFFVVQTKEGQVFTRKGDLTVNRSNQIVTQAGDPVMGEGGPVSLGNGKIQINGNGVVYVDNNEVGRLRLVDFTNRQALKNVGGGIYQDPGGGGMKKVEKPNIASGFIELSNVNVVKEMADMIDIHRSFETYQKIIQTMSDADKMSTGRIGRIG